MPAATPELTRTTWRLSVGCSECKEVAPRTAVQVLPLSARCMTISSLETLFAMLGLRIDPDEIASCPQGLICGMAWKFDSEALATHRHRRTLTALPATQRRGVFS